MPLRKLAGSWSLPGPKSDGITLAKVSLADTAMDKRSVERVKDGSETAVVPGKLPVWAMISILICQHCSERSDLACYPPYNYQSKCWRIASIASPVAYRSQAKTEGRLTRSASVIILVVEKVLLLKSILKSWV